MAHERIDGETPNGGAYSVAQYLDANGKECEKADASQVRIFEYSSDGEVVFSTYGTFDNGRTQ